MSRFYINDLRHQSSTSLATATSAFAFILSLAGNAIAQDGTGGGETSTPLEAIVIQATESEQNDDKTVTAKRSRGATKIDTPLIETPRSVSVITKKELEERAASNVVEAVRYTAGVTTASTGFDPRYDVIMLRGQVLSLNGDYRDGLRQYYVNYGNFPTEPYSLERVEVVKGPVSVLYGAGSPGGIINKVSKEPLEQPFHEVGILWGTKDRAQATFDFSGPVKEGEDNLFYRLTGLARYGDTNFDIADDRYMLQPSLRWNPDAATSLTLYGLLQSDESDGSPGAVIAPDGRVLDIRASDPDYDHQKVRQQQVGYRFEHEFDNGLTFRQNTRYSHMDLRTRYLSVSSWTDTIAHRGATALRDDAHIFQIDNQLEAKFDTGPFAHTMLFGLDYTYLTSSFGYGLDWVPNPAYDLDITNPRYGVSGPTPDYNFSLLDKDINQTGIYALDQIEADKWRFTLGARQTWVKQTLDTTYPTAGTRDHQSETNTATSVQTGALYLFDNGIAPFANYATSFDPATQRSASGRVLEPTKGEQFEAGVKYQPPGTNLLFSATAYHLVEKNKPQLVDLVSLSYQSLGEVTTKGLELEARTAFDSGLDLIASYTLSRSEITGGGENVGKEVAARPHHVASLWANYTFAADSAAKGLSVGAGLRYNGRSYTDNANTAENASTFYVDAGMSYDFGAVNKDYAGLVAAVNVRNIANQRDAMCESGFCYLGQGRNVTASVRYRW